METTRKQTQLGWTDFIQNLVNGHSAKYGEQYNPQKKPNEPRIKDAGLYWQRYALECALKDLKNEILGSLRLVRIDRFGMAGLLLYEVPQKRPLLDDQALSEQTLLGGIDADLVVVFDQLRARVVYIPSYACTSFVTGQIMNALVHATLSEMAPKPASEGISIDRSALTRFDFLPCSLTTPYRPKPVIKVRHLLKSTSSRFETRKVSLEKKNSNPLENASDKRWDSSMENFLGPTLSGSPSKLFPTKRRTLRDFTNFKLPKSVKRRSKPDTRKLEKENVPPTRRA